MWILAGAPVLICALYLWNGPVDRDNRARPGVLRVEGTRLNPDWVRPADGGPITIENPGTADVTVRLPQSNVTLVVKAGQSVDHTLARPDGLFSISQVFVTVPGRTHSSFVIVDRKD